MAPKTQLSGSVASVLHYNGIARILVSIFSRICCIPMIGHFGDSGFLVPAAISAQVVKMAQWARFAYVGLALKLSKSHVVHVATFLGMRGSTRVGITTVR